MSLTTSRLPFQSSFAICVVLWLAVDGRPASAEVESVSFNRDIRPILSEFCFQCHGPDAKQRKADLRLDSDEQLFVDRDGHRVLVAGDVAKSELFRRLTSTDADEQMPPANLGKKPTQAQIDLIRRWIEQGAKWEKHWSLIPPKRPVWAQISNLKSQISNPVDRFVLARLER